MSHNVKMLETPPGFAARPRFESSPKLLWGVVAPRSSVSRFLVA
ncbi:hypothetical protein [Nocardia sp. NPDC047648]